MLVGETGFCCPNPRIFGSLDKILFAKSAKLDPPEGRLPNKRPSFRLSDSVETRSTTRSGRTNLICKENTSKSKDYVASNDLVCMSDYFSDWHAKRPQNAKKNNACSAGYCVMANVHS